MAERQSYLVIGNGIAGATAAEILRTEDAAADITVIADDPFPVYYRPALKDYLGGKVREEKLWARPISFYPDRRVRFVTDRVISIAVPEHTVQLRSGSRLGYSRLLLAHGARASTLRCPGANLIGVTTLRTVADYQRVLARLGETKRVVVSGSGTLALESIETLRHRGLQVTHLLRRRTLWSEVLDPVASDLVLQQEQRAGVDVRTEQEIAEIIGKDGQVTGIVTTTGAKIACELVLLGIGIEPVIDFVRASGIVCGKGVKVDGAMRTNAPDVYAAGDLIEATDPITAQSRVIGQWYPSIQQARAAAYSMLDLLDTSQPFRFGNFYNATFLYGLDFASVGLSNIPKNGQGYQEIVAEPQPRMYQKVILKEGVPVGMLALGDRQSVLIFKRAIDHQVNLSAIASRLFAPDFKLKEWLDSQGVPPPILGVSREGALAVKKAAYADTGNRSAILKASALSEAYLVMAYFPDGKLSTQETYLSQTKVTTIGRQPGANLVIYHNSISRRHAEITYANGQYVLRDLGSKNGTFVNDTRLEPGSTRILTMGDRLRFGKVSYDLKKREAQLNNSMLVRKPKDIPSVVHGEADLEEEADGKQKVEVAALSDDFKTMAASSAQAVMLEQEAKAAAGQPEAKPDKSLLLPGAVDAIPSVLVGYIKKSPTLVAILSGIPKVFLLKESKRYSIGRDVHNDIVLLDMSISRQHAEVYHGPDGIFIRDLKSSNGVEVNSTKIDAPYRLSHNERISIGNVPVYFLDYQTQRASPVEMRVRDVVHPHEHQAHKKTCRHCGIVSSVLARFCPGCGTPLREV